MGPEAGLVKIGPLDIVDADGKDNQVRVHAPQVLLPFGAMQPGLGRSAVDAGLAQAESAAALVQIHPAQGELLPGRSAESNLHPVGVVRQVEVGKIGPYHTPERIAPLQEQHGFQLSPAQDVHAVEAIAVLHLQRLPGQQVHNDAGRRILRSDEHAGEAQLFIGRLETGDAFPVADVGSVVAHGRVGEGRREGENQAPAAVHAIAKAQEVLAQTVAQGAALHMRAAHMEHPHISPAATHQRVQFAKEKLIIRRLAGGVLKNALVCPDKRIPMRHGGEHQQA